MIFTHVSASLSARHKGRIIIEPPQKNASTSIYLDNAASGRLPKAFTISPIELALMISNQTRTIQSTLTLFILDFLVDKRTKLQFQPFCALQWRHNGRDSVWNHQPQECLLNRLFRRRSKKTSKLRVTSLCAGNSPGTGEFPAQMASDAENVSIWWRHHGRWEPTGRRNCSLWKHRTCLSYMVNAMNIDVLLTQVAKASSPTSLHWWFLDIRGAPFNKNLGSLHLVHNSMLNVLYRQTSGNIMMKTTNLCVMCQGLTVYLLWSWVYWNKEYLSNTN